MNLRSWLLHAASLKLTVALLTAGMFLTLAGTLAQTNNGIWMVVDEYFRSLVVWVPFQLFFHEETLRLPGAIPFPGGLTIGTLLFVNLTAAFIVRFTWSIKRVGVIISHAGVILLLAGEFVTGMAATEGRMTIDEGGSANYTEDNRTSELAVVDRSNAQEDHVVVVPQRLLGTGRRVVDPRLPFDIEVLDWMPNSGLLGPMQATKSQLERADAGLGTQIAAVRVPEATGVDGGTIDVPSAYVRLVNGGTKLGTFLVSVGLASEQPVTFGGKTYDISLRFKRDYKPYTVNLIDFKHDRFLGTNTARNFSSLVRLKDPKRNVDREVLIYMNNPLRHAGETFYQSSFNGETTTVLQVVRNPGWMLPYFSCGMVTVGLLIHFGVRLAAPIRRNVR
ncbi:MAG: cytochrome c biogenesis protein ResB [Phycisphaerales bacterium]